MMNRGNIPGFYFDEEKQKYFKIQANHLLPAFANKYSKGNVEQEKRLAKRRKLEKKHEQTRPVKRHPLLLNAAISGSGLHRELGNISLTETLESRAVTTVSEWRRTRDVMEYQNSTHFLTTAASLPNQALYGVASWSTSDFFLATEGKAKTYPVDGPISSSKCFARSWRA
jgi:hypothetical protein